MGLALGRVAVEQDAADPSAPGWLRSAAEVQVQVQALARRAVRAQVIRLPPSVHGDGDKGLVPQLFAAARKAKTSGYVGEGANRWAGVHVRDTARLFRLALEHGAAGASYHGVADEGVAFRKIAQVIARRLNVPAAPVTPAEAKRRFSWLAPFVAADNPVSSAWTQQALGWTPTERGFLVDIDRAAYFGG